MSTNPVKVIQDTEAALGRLSAKLDTINTQIVTLSAKAREAGANLAQIKTGQDADKKLRDRLALKNKLIAAIKEEERLEIQLTRAMSKNAHASSELSRATERQKMLSSEKIKIVKEDIILSRQSSKVYEALVVKMNRAGKEVQKLTAKKAQGIKLDRAEQRELKKSTRDFNRYRAAVTKADHAIGRHQRNVGNYTNSLRRLGLSFKTLIAGFGVYGGAALGAKLLSDVFKITKKLQSLRFALKAVSDDMEQVASVESYLSRITNAYGADIIVTTERFTKFFAASKQTNLGLQQTKQIFESVTKASGVLGLKTEELQGIYLALEQMLSKGKITTEELRRQLGERLPGAFNIMANAVGVSTIELDKMLKKGELLSAEWLPKFAIELEKAYGIESLKSVETLAASQVRMTNEYTAFIASLDSGKGVVSGFFISAIEGATGFLKVWREINQGEEGELKRSYDNRKEAARSYYEDIKNYESQKIELARISLANDNLSDQQKLELKAEIAAYEKLMFEEAQRYAKEEVKNTTFRQHELKTEIEKLEERNNHLAESDKGLKKIFNTTAQILSLGRFGEGDIDEYKANEKAIAEYNAELAQTEGTLDGLKEVLESKVDVKADTLWGILGSTADVVLNFKKYEYVVPKLQADLAELVEQEKAMGDVNKLNITQINELNENREKQKEIQTELDKILGKSEKQRKKTFQAVQGSVLWLKKELSEAIQQRDGTATDTRRWWELNDAVDEAQKKIDDFMFSVNGADFDSEGGLAQAVEAITEILSDPDFGNLDGFDYSGADSQVQEGLDKRMQRRADQLKREVQIYAEAFDLMDNQYQGFFEEQGLGKLYETFVKTDEYGMTMFERLRIAGEDSARVVAAQYVAMGQVAAEVFNKIGSIMNEISQQKIQKYEDEIEANKDYYAQILDNENLSVRQRDYIEAQREAKDRKIQKKIRQEKRKQAQTNKATATFEAIVNTAAAVTSALKESVFMSILVGALGAAQIALIASQPIPKYEKGKGNYDNYEGIAIWGEKRQEAKISKDGSIEVSPKRPANHLTHVKKDDIIHPDANRLFENISGNSVLSNEKELALSNLYNNTSQISSAFANKIAERFSSDDIVKAINQKKGTNVRINQSINLGDDINFMNYLNNTL